MRLFRRRKYSKPVERAAEWMEEIVARSPGSKIEGALLIVEVRSPNMPGTGIIYAGHEREHTKNSEVLGLIAAVDKQTTAMSVQGVMAQQRPHEFDPKGD